MTVRAPLLASAVLALLVGAAACDLRTAATEGPYQPTVQNLLDAGDGAILTTVEAGAPGDANAPELRGSPLCASRPEYDCYPDDPSTSTAKFCDLAPDGGPYSAQAGYDNVSLACRVEVSPSAPTGVQPVCVAAGSAGDGSWCKSSEECLPTYDCVAAGTCQRYCCSGNTECLTDQFCDIQPTVLTSSVLVPVCMPIHPAGGCTLLDPASCQQTAASETPETCAVVREDGTTSCVAVGTAKAGQSCDYDHCAANLVCLGTPGQRVCYQLCHTANTASTNECSASPQQACKGGLPLFPDPSVGICE